MITPSKNDGFNGARDAAILERCDIEKDIAHVQRTYETKDLLQRAGYKRTRTHQHYPVKVCRDRFDRFQLVPFDVLE